MHEDSHRDQLVLALGDLLQPWPPDFQRHRPLGFRCVPARAIICGMSHDQRVDGDKIVCTTTMHVEMLD